MTDRADPEGERMDQETVVIIDNLLSDNTAFCIAPNDANEERLDRSRDALDARIRQRIDEARKEGFEKGYAYAEAIVANSHADIEHDHRIRRV